MGGDEVQHLLIGHYVCVANCTRWCLSSVLDLGCYPLMLSNAGIFVFSHYHLPLPCFSLSTRVFLRSTEFISYFLVPRKGVCQSHLISHTLLVEPESAVSGPFLNKHTMSHPSYSLLFNGRARNSLPYTFYISRRTWGTQSVEYPNWPWGSNTALLHWLTHWEQNVLCFWETHISGAMT